MALAPKLLGYFPTIGAPDWAVIQAVASGSYTIVTGDTLNTSPSAWSDPNGKGILGEPLALTTIPPSVETENLGGYYAQFVPGTTLSNGKIHFYSSQGAELASGAYPAAITGGVLTIKVPLR